MKPPQMSGAIEHPLVQKIIDYQRSMARGDLVSGRTVFAPDVVYTVPGHNPFSGTYRGPDGVMGYFGRLMEVTGGSYEITDMVWLACVDKVILQTVNTAAIFERTLQWQEAVLFTFKDGLKSRIDLFQADQAAVDGFFAQ